MVLGLRSKSKQISSVQVEYTVEILEIKPWPASQSLKSICSVVLQWETGDRRFGLTNPITPSIAEGKIEIYESFRLLVTLMKESSTRSNGSSSFLKNIIQFYLHEPKKDKAVKGQLGTAVLDLAQHGIIKDSLRIGVPMNFKRSFRNVSQPILYVNLQSFEKNGSESSSSESLPMQVALDRDSKGSVLTLMSEEYAEEDEIASFSDEDDATSHSSLPNSHSFVENNADLLLERCPKEKSLFQNISETTAKVDGEEDQARGSLIVKEESILHDDFIELKDKSIQPSPVGLSIELGCFKKDNLGLLKLHNEGELEMTFRSSANENSKCSLRQEEEANLINLLQEDNMHKNLFDKEVNALCSDQRVAANESSISDDVPGRYVKQENCNEETDTKNGVEHDEEIQSSQHENSNGTMSPIRRKKVSFSVNSPLHEQQNKGHAKVNPSLEEVNETTEFYSIFDSGFSDKKLHELECRVKVLEGELREAAAMEMGLYSVVAEHGSSAHKVHTPARRLSRLYLYASKLLPGQRRAGAARSVVSGLGMVLKACGNDIPRLTFWLSNSVLLRAIVSHSISKSEYPKYSMKSMTNEDTKIILNGKNLPLKWEPISLSNEKPSLNKELNDWDDPQTFFAALEKVEAWIFTRIVQFVWWQIIVPYMQSSSKSNQWKKRFERGSNLDEKNPSSCSFEIWKKVFQDACESLCPVRAKGHECGCLAMLAKQVMEQCVMRLDVAMFNALLLESDDENSTDPVAHPITNHMVLPIPPGKSSFGAGAQLKNAIGNWSRSLTDLFEMDVDDSSPDKDEICNEKIDVATSVKTFQLLNALSDIFMLPKHMLLEKKVREEVCPTFSSAIIKRILSSFFPDEFCPDQVPASVFEALDSEEQMVGSVDGTIRSLPCNAPPISYSPPSPTLVQSIVGIAPIDSTRLKRSGSSLTRKSHASDDELEEFDSPFSTIIFNKPSSSSSSLKEKENASRSSFRYQLLRDVWKFDD